MHTVFLGEPSLPLCDLSFEFVGDLSVVAQSALLLALVHLVDHLDLGWAHLSSQIILIILIYVLIIGSISLIAQASIEEIGALLRQPDQQAVLFVRELEDKVFGLPWPYQSCLAAVGLLYNERLPQLVD